MCGILGAITSGFVSENTIKKGLNHSIYRGPDNQGIHMFDLSNDRQVILGFNRLAIQDLSERANQPFSKNDVCIVFNGEIYNKDDISRKEGFGSLYTHSDTEIILELYLKYGGDFPKHLNGMFSIVILDQKRKKLIIVRDRFGIKPLYYGLSNNDLYFSSDIFGIYQLLTKTKERSTIFLQKDYFIRNLLLDPFVGFKDTPFQNINTFPKGTMLEINLSNNEYNWVEFYNFKAIKTDRYVEDINLREIFERAVKSHLVSDVPVSCALSGGFDSSSITFLSSMFLDADQDLTCFTVNLKEKAGEFNEDYKYAYSLFDSLKKRNKELIPISLDETWSLELIDKIVIALGSPIYDERVLVWNNMYKKVHERDIKVLLNGQGADEMWYGYYPDIWDWFSCLYHHAFTYDSISDYLFRRTRDSVFANALVIDKNKYLEQYSIELFKEITQISSEDDSQKKISLFMIEHVLESLLRFEDTLSMLHSVEVRVPFLDNDLSEFALKLSPIAHMMGHSGEQVIGKDYLKYEMSVYKELHSIIFRRKSPLPKPKSHDADLLQLFRENYNNIKNSQIVGTLFDTKKIFSAIDKKNENFYGGINDFLLQIISIWRFEELFNHAKI